MRYQRCHDEVLGALQALGDPAFGLHMAKDRRSEMRYVGIRVPALRERVKQGFSFYDRTAAAVLAIWDDLWMGSEWGDVLFAAQEYYRPILRKRGRPVDAGLWPVMRHWVRRVDNWAHSDVLSDLYSRLLAAHPDQVMPELRRWNAAEPLWPRRASIVSLIHYTGRNAAFLPPDTVLPMVDNCVEDRRYYMRKAVGWVLREMWRAHPEEIRAYVEGALARMPADALSRAMEKQPPGERARLRALRQQAQQAG